MTQPRIVVTATGKTSSAVTAELLMAGSSAQAWFAGGERVGYNPNARAVVAAEDAPLKIFWRRDGDVARRLLLAGIS